MSVKGEYLESVSLSSTEFQIYNVVFSEKLVALFKVAYQEIVSGSHADSKGFWKREAFFHGTGHCGCLETRVSNSENERIQAKEWCGNENCATQGILNHGHLRIKCPSQGHYFSPNLVVPRQFAENKSMNHRLLSIFVCKARNVNEGHAQDILFVSKDKDILPFYLAIVRRE